MAKALCTIVDGDHIANALATIGSARNYYRNFTPVVVVTGDFVVPKSIHGIHFLKVNDLANKSSNVEITGNYGGDQLRWALKPCLLDYLLAKFHKVIYVDCDIYFFSDWSFLWDEISTVLLTPHWRDPKQRCNGLHGIYNAGFVGVSREGLDAIAWWRDLVAWKCEVDVSQGLFVDQKYLESMPIFWDVQICRHRGCNVAPWNTKYCRRVRQSDGSILIEDKWKVVFCHFSAMHTDDGSLAEFAVFYYDDVENARKLLGKISN